LYTTARLITSEGIDGMKDLLPHVALSVRQPWAWAIIYAGKDIENRSPAAIRHFGIPIEETEGVVAHRICIHASRGMTRDEYDDAAAFMKSIGVECPRPDQLVRGGIIGTVDVEDIVDEHESEWFFGPCGLLLANAKPCAPVFLPGALGYFNWAHMLAKHGEGCAAEQPLPWMLAWPNEPMRKGAKPKELAPDPQRALL
jgi:hypothetical protein